MGARTHTPVNVFARSHGVGLVLVTSVPHRSGAPQAASWRSVFRGQPALLANEQLATRPPNVLQPWQQNASELPQTMVYIYLECGNAGPHARRAELSHWAKARIKIVSMLLTIKLNRNWNSFQLANSAPPLNVTDSAIAPSARIR